jgi:signal peptidase I
MSDTNNTWNIRKLVAQFRTSDHWAVALARDLLWIVCVVGGVALALFLICGTWPAVVTIESQSMVPHMNVGDLVIVVQKDRYGPFETWADGKQNGYIKYSDYGDVIIYKPNGLTSVHPIIHRAIQYVDDEQVTEIKGMKLLGNYTPPHAGYITWGDNNPRPDQGTNFPGIGTIEPVKEDWIVGKALFSIPLVGYLPLHIIEVTIIVVALMVLHELYLSSREDKKNNQKNKSGKKRR